MNTDGRIKPRETMTEEMLHALTKCIIGAAFNVSNALGCGFLEKVYENALAHELRKGGLRVEQQHPIPVHYDGVQVGDFYADLLVEGVVLIELKAVRAFEDVHEAQCLNYLKGTGLSLCLLLNFGKPRVEVKRLRR
jgi:GxxExxY protein